ncbi:type V CRISPR-associated protein Cas12k [Phormidesmis priestleyi]
MSFKSRGLSHLCLRLYCDRRQLPVFRQLVEESEANKARKQPDKFSLALSPLRSAGLMWVEDPQQLHKKNHRKLKNLWLKWFSHMSCQDFPAKIWEQWFQSLVYLCLSYNLPWQTHRLYLHATIDPRLLTAEGTEAVRQEKIALMGKFLKGLKEADEMPMSEELSEEEQAELLTAEKNRRTVTKKNQTTLTRLQNNSPPPRPSRVAYQGNPDIAVKVAFSREHIAGVAVSDGCQPVLDYRDIKSLLVDPRVELLEQRSRKLRNQPERLRKAKLATQKSKPSKSKYPRFKPKISTRQLQLQPYRLLKRWRRLKRENGAKRQLEQRHGLYRPSQAESNLAQYINHLLGRNIVDLCQRWSAGSIILPEFGDLRESIESEIQAKAKRKYPDDNVERQKQYAKEFRMEFHRWNYQHLTQSFNSMYSQPCCHHRREMCCRSTT